MQLVELVPLLKAQVLALGQQDRSLSCGYVCDLLSWVMARGQKDMAWVTVQTHLNVVAVASLHEMACIILPDGIVMEEPVLDKAREEGIAVLSSPLSAYAICSTLGQAGLPPPV